MKRCAWIPDMANPHSHVYYYLVAEQIVGKIGPNPAAGTRCRHVEGPWAAYIVRGGWKLVGDAWSKRDAQDIVVERLCRC